MGDSQVAYLGLENIRSHTGELVDFSLRLASTVKSRSKRFQPGDILFGRLRPELNKVYLVEGEPSHGICSGELLVLAPNASVANGVYVRHVLASAFVASCIKKFRAGASLPRISAQDLLSIRVPLAPLDVQEEIAKRLSEIDSQLKSLRRRIEELPRRQKEVLMLAVGSGSDRDGEY
jgi:restriction endonuclease S subunit